MELIYIIFSGYLVIQVLFFLFLNLPTPAGVKGKVVKFLSTSVRVQAILGIHALFTLIAIVLYADCYRV